MNRLTTGVLGTSIIASLGCTVATGKSEGASSLAPSPASIASANSEEDQTGPLARKYQGHTARWWANQFTSSGPLNGVPETQYLIRLEAAEALAELQAESLIHRQAIPVLLTHLTGRRDFVVRAGAATSLGLLGRFAESALPALRQAAERDSDPQVQNSAAWAVERISEDVKRAQASK